ncbi:DUF1775 domain-containing protein [Streptomyces sp. NPDC004726]
MRKSQLSPVARRAALSAVAALGAVLAVAAPAAAHAGVTASDARALAKNVTLTFTSEAESETAGIAKLQVVLPEGVSPGAVAQKKLPKGWTFAQSQGGYIVSGKPLPIGTDAVHSIVVRQLPDAKKLVFKTVETYGDGKIARWIEVSEGGKKPENPAPVLELKPKAAGATLEPPGPVQPESPAPGTSQTPAPASTPTPSTVPSAGPSSAPTPGDASPTEVVSTAKEKDGGSGTIVIVVVAVVAVVGGAAFWLIKRRSGASS